MSKVAGHIVRGPGASVHNHGFMARVEWLVPEWELTVNQEFFCWRYALHGNGMKAMREAYGQVSRKHQNSKAHSLLHREKILNRIKHLIEEHRTKKINLKAGPWAYYDRFDVGFPVDPGNKVTPLVREIRGNVEKGIIGRVKEEE